MKLLITYIFINLLTISYAQEYWEKIQTPVDLRLNTMFCLDSSNIWIGADSGKILYTSDKGSTWSVYESGVQENIVKLFFLDEDYGWGLTHYEDFPIFRSIILKTTNGGETWENSFYRIENVFLYSIIFFDTLNGWIAGDKELAYTEDGGLNWASPAFDSTFLYFPIYELKFYNKQTGYAVGGYIDFAGVVWGTIDSGKTWSSEFVTADPPYDIHLFSEDEAYALTSDIEHNYNIEVLRTTNRGEDWFIEILDVYGTVSAIDFRNDYEGWATMGRDNLALITSDSGKTWDYYPMPDSLGVYDVKFPDSLNGYMVGDAGSFFRYIPKEPSSVIDMSDIKTPVSFNLFQNYPNPFNAQTEIRYSIAEESFIKLKLMNILGEEIKILEEGVKEPGTYSLQIELNGMASGTYLYQLIINNGSGYTSETKKMILLK